MRTLSNNGTRIFRNCARQYEIEYIQLRSPARKAEALAFGGAWDLALQSWWRGVSAEDRLLRALPVLERELRDETLRAKATAMMIGYSAKWGDEPLRVIATQVEFVAPIVHPDTGEVHPVFASHGIMDAVVEHIPTGRRLALESKTSGEDISPGSAYWQRVGTMDTQVSTYLDGAKSAGHAVDSVIFDVAAKPALRLGKTETPVAYMERCARDIQARPGWYFQRQELVRLERDEREHARDLWAYADAIVEAERTRRFPRNPDRCRQYGRACDFLPVCAGEADLSDPVLYRKRERKDVTTRQGSEGKAA